MGWRVTRNDHVVEVAVCQTDRLRWLLLLLLQFYDLGLNLSTSDTISIHLSCARRDDEVVLVAKLDLLCSHMLLRQQLLLCDSGDSLAIATAENEAINGGLGLISVS